MRLIDADAMRQEWLENGENEYVYDANAVLNSIDAQPTIDTVKHGKWIEDTVGCFNPFDPYKEDYMDVIICSECGIYYGTETRANYCPHCGARMDGE